jgi:pyrroloquinoline-quinone synthase
MNKQLVKEDQVMTQSNTSDDSAFWKSVELRSDKHALHDHRYFGHLFGQEGDIWAVKLFAEQFFTFCKTFHNCLGGLISSTNSQEMIAILSDNLFDEMGRGDIAESHLEILKRLFRSIDYTEKEIDNIKPLPITVELNDRMIEVSRRDFFVGMGAVGLGAEFAGARFFQNVHNEFSKKPFLKHAALNIYQIHAGDDTRHRADMKRALSRLKFSWVEEAKMLGGIQLSHLLFHNLWEGLGEASGFYTAGPRPIPPSLQIVSEHIRQPEPVYVAGSYMPSC